MEKIGLCMYCGLACRLVYTFENGELRKVRPLKTDPVSRGAPCIKGLTIHEVVAKGRLKRPLIRRSPWRPPREASWQEALDVVADWLRDADPYEIAVVASGKTSNEDVYALVKLARGVLGTPNIDNCCGRLCHAPTIAVLKDLYGIPASPGYLDDIDELDALLLAGTNPASNYPVMFNRIMRARRLRSLKLVTVDPVRSETSRYSDYPLGVRPGSELVVFNYFAKTVIERRAYPDHVEEIPGFRNYKKSLQPYDLDFASRISGVEKTLLSSAADALIEAKIRGVANGMGLTQHSNSVESLYALYNLALLLDAKIVTGRGEINVQGAGDMGALPDALPTGGMETYVELSRLWGLPVEPVKGLTITETLFHEPMSIYMISAMNPAHSMPAADIVAKRLENGFTVQMDSYYNQTSEYATVILPTPLLIERDGTVTSGERRVRSIGKPLEHPAQTRREWVIAAGIAERLGFKDKFSYENTWSLTREYVRVIPAYRAVDPLALEKGEDQWASKQVKWRRFRPPVFRGLDAAKTRGYPWILTSFRSSHHFLSNEATSKSETLSKFPEKPYLYMNPRDLECLNLREGDVVRLCTRHACKELPVAPSSRVPRGMLGVYWHFREVEYNKLVPLLFETRTMTPQYKNVPARLEVEGKHLNPCTSESSRTTS
ncbi:MAG: molybdopterin-dependent oxidoreductase [Desulfurococcales archaeon]|nr:molybdopterin-dependent oxidoreductase [Desulfurococcales archaeon]